MASSIIHICVAKEINKVLKIKETNNYFLGSIAPDISKLVGDPRSKSHFYDENGKTNIDKFLKKYKDKLNNPFILGYFIHLYTDLIWEKYFLNNIVEGNYIKKIDGTKVENTNEMYKKLIYNDYTNLNIG